MPRAISSAVLLFTALLVGCHTTPKANDAPPARAPAPPAAVSISSATGDIAKNDLPLRAVSTMEKLVAEKKVPPQYAAQLVAMLGVESATDAVFYTGMKPQGAASLDVSELRALDAMPEIVAAAKTKRIVVINESHTSQRQRAFGHLLAKELRSAGFTHLGFEGINPGKGEEVLKLGPRVGAGFYMMDPFFADFIRQSMAMGYAVFEYEQRRDQQPPVGTDRDKSQDARERAQAENIMRVLKANPNAKIMLYVGGGHGMKEMFNWQKFESMAIHLQRLSGFEILSIDQQGGTPITDPRHDSPVRQAVEPLISKSRSTVFRKKDGQWLSHLSYDFIVFHPRMPEINGRAGWMEMDGYRKKQIVKLTPLASRTLLRARATPLVEGAITYDQVVIAPQQTEAAPFLPVGEYELFRESESGDTEELGRVSVK